MRFILIGLFLIGSVFAQTTPQPASQPLLARVIDLHYVKAETLIPQLTIFLQPGERVGGTGNSLLLSVSPETLTQIRPIIHKLDSPPVVFNISIQQGDPDSLNEQNTSEVVYSVSSRNQSSNAQSVSVMSGKSAYISMGSDRPVISSVSGGWEPGISYQQKEEKQGFYIRPVLQGSQVKINIQRTRDQANPVNDQASQNQTVETTTMIPLNKWVKLGATGQGSANSQPSSTTYSAGNSYTNETTLYIRISVAK